MAPFFATRKVLALLRWLAYDSLLFHRSRFATFDKSVGLHVVEGVLFPLLKAHVWRERMRPAILKVLTIAAVLQISAAHAAAQTATEKPAEPEAIGIFYYLDAHDHTLKRLPKEDFEKHTKAVPFGSITNAVRVAGEQSQFHINASDPATFLFKVFKDEDAGGARLFQVTALAIRPLLVYATSR